MVYYQYSRLIGRCILTLAVLFVAHFESNAKQDSLKITLNESNATIEFLIKKIEEQTGYTFLYAISELNGNEIVPKIHVKSATIDEALSKILKGKNLTWKIKDKLITIKSKNQKAIFHTDAIKDTNALITIQGSVTTDEGQPMPGATIAIKATGQGTVTGKDGKFRLTSVQKNATIEITHMGYESQQFVTKSSETLVVQMRRTAGTLDEQVVIAYGTSSKRLLTGNIGRITSNDIQKQPVSNPLQSMQGRISGVVITQQTGVPGGNFTVQIRGQNSLRTGRNDNGNYPLYVIDGVPIAPTTIAPEESKLILGSLLSSPLNSINTSDIQSIEILKDADATSIYGSLGANGVILITTKKGERGNTKFDINAYTGIATVSKKIQLLSTQEYLEMRREAFKNDNITTLPANAFDLTKWSSDRYTDWQRELIGGTAKTTDIQTSISGGNLHTQFRFGGGYHRETTVFPGDFSDQRITSHISINNSSENKRFQSSISANYTNITSNLLKQDLTAFALSLPPNAPSLYDQNGNLNWENSTWTNPLSYTKTPYSASTNSLISNMVIGYKILPTIEAKSSFGYSYSNMKSLIKTPLSSIDPAKVQTSINQASQSDATIKGWIIEPQITWKQRVEKGHLDILLGASLQSRKNDAISQLGTGFSNEALMNSFQFANSISILSSANTAYKYAAAFARVNYNYQARYILNITGRRDGSSRFGSGKQFANFGAVGVAWIFSDETFIKKSVPWLSHGKIRSSLGVTGNDQIKDYGYLDTYTGGGTYLGMASLNPSRLANPEYSWETNQKSEVSLEIGLFNDKILLTSSYYRNKASNQLVGYTLPPTTGFGTVQYNLDAIIINKGVEFDLSTINLNSRRFSWKSTINVSFPKNKLVDFPNIDGSPYASIFKIGEPLSIQYLYNFNGVDPETGVYTFVDKTGKITSTLTSADRYVTKFIGPKYYGGFLNNIKIGRVELDLNFQFVKQDGYNYLSAYYFLSAPGAMANQPKYALNRWKNTGDITDVQRFTTVSSPTYSYYSSSEAVVTDASFIRLKNVSISIPLPQKWTQSALLRNCRFYAQGQNIITITKYKGLDPESQSGITLPPLRVLTAGIQITL